MIPTGKENNPITSLTDYQRTPIANELCAAEFSEVELRKTVPDVPDFFSLCDLGRFSGCASQLLSNCVPIQDAQRQSPA